MIPEGEYGAGTVMVWDQGTWTPEFAPKHGYRKGPCRVKLLTRQGLGLTDRFGTMATAVADLPVKSALIDAEIVVQTETGAASFAAVVDALKSGAGNLVLYAFDLLHLGGFDLRDASLADRNAALGNILDAHGDNSRIRFDNLPRTSANRHTPEKIAASVS